MSWLGLPKFGFKYQDGFVGIIDAEYILKQVRKKEKTIQILKVKYFLHFYTVTLHSAGTFQLLPNGTNVQFQI